MLFISSIDSINATQIAYFTLKRSKTMFVFLKKIFATAKQYGTFLCKANVKELFPAGSRCANASRGSMQGGCICCVNKIKAFLLVAGRKI